MPLLGFQKQFAPMVENGLRLFPYASIPVKRQTIRAKRRDGRNPKPGERLFIYTGLRTKKCLKLGEAICKSVDEIVVDWRGGGICVAGEWLSGGQIDQMAMADGFRDFNEMAKWFEKTHHEDFQGLLIKW
jgi:hypothetical protein